MAAEFYINQKDMSDDCILPDGVCRGDLVIFVDGTHNYRYRNEGVRMWTGEKLVMLDTFYDDYGSVPKDFRVGKEFSPKHWKHAIDHNSLVYLDDDLYDKFVFKQFHSNIVGYLEVRGRTFTVRNDNDQELTPDRIEVFRQNRRPVEFSGTNIHVYI